MPQVVFTLGDDVSTDAIYPGRFMATVLPTETPQYAFADFEINARLKSGQVPAGSVIVATAEILGCMTAATLIRPDVYYYSTSIAAEIRTFKMLPIERCDFI